MYFYRNIRFFCFKSNIYLMGTYPQYYFFIHRLFQELTHIFPDQYMKMGAA